MRILKTLIVPFFFSLFIFLAIFIGDLIDKSDPDYIWTTADVLEVKNIPHHNTLKYTYVIDGVEYTCTIESTSTLYYTVGDTVQIRCRTDNLNQSWPHLEKTIPGYLSNIFIPVAALAVWLCECYDEFILTKHTK